MGESGESPLMGADYSSSAYSMSPPRSGTAKISRHVGRENGALASPGQDPSLAKGVTPSVPETTHPVHKETDDLQHDAKEKAQPILRPRSKVRDNDRQGNDKKEQKNKDRPNKNGRGENDIDPRTPKNPSQSTIPNLFARNATENRPRNATTRPNKHSAMIRRNDTSEKGEGRPADRRRAEGESRENAKKIVLRGRSLDLGRNRP